MSRLVVALSLFVPLLLSRRASAADVPPEKLATILTRTLSYDEHLEARAKGAITIAVIAKNGDSRSQACADALTPAFQRLERIRVHGMPLKSARIAWESAARLKAQIGELGIDMLVVCDGLSSVVPQITATTRANQITSAGVLLDDVRDGLSIGVSMEDSQSTITVNLEASRAEGAAFSSELLHLARIVR